MDIKFLKLCFHKSNMIKNMEGIVMKKEIIIEKEIDYFLDDESIYSEDVRDQLLDDDELTPSEAGFMKGYDEAYV